ncbi:MAG: sigma-70 family RNA polymerase sigma factor [Planctomycetes bacterium]|nr:sigma-70 family RNA polymerase sigma factor [Planctomycetota bacterium]
MTPAAIDEAEVRGLLQQVRDGDRGALDVLLARHRSYLLDVVQLRMDQKLRARIDPSDVVQEAQLEAAQRIEDYLGREPMPFHIWLRKTAYENLLRLRRQHVEAECRSVEKQIALPDNSSAMLALKILSREPNPGNQAVEQELARRLRHAIAQLPEVDAEIVLMRNLEGLTNLETAQVLDLEPAATSKRYGRAILKLRQLLFEGGLSDSAVGQTF